MTLSRTSHIVSALVALLCLAAAFAPPAEARWEGSRWTFKRFHCPDKAYRRDPIGVIFTGPAATQRALGSFVTPHGVVKGDIETHTHWGLIPAYERYEYANSDACWTQDFESGTGGRSRHHVRAWEQRNPHAGGHRTAGTPHYDQHLDRCNGHHVPPGPVPLAFGGTGSGFDATRERLRWWYVHNAKRHHHTISEVYWRDDYLTSQCKRTKWTSSNGWVLLITIGR